MRTALIATALIFFMLVLAMSAAEQTATVRGYVLDSACAFTKSLDKPVSRACALACAKSGSPLVILADDGNIYLARWTGKHPIIVISPAGEVVRKINLVPPREGWDAFHFFVAGGKIAMEFFQPGAQESSSTVMYSLYDAESGERQGDYTLAPGISGKFACYTPNQFTFLTIQDDGLFIIHAVPR